MIIELTKDKRERICSCCKKRIKKGSIIVKYEEVIDGFRNIRMWFAHIRCLTMKLLSIESKIKKKLEAVPKISFSVERYIK